YEVLSTKHKEPSSKNKVQPQSISHNCTNLDLRNFVLYLFATRCCTVERFLLSILTQTSVNSCVASAHVLLNFSKSRSSPFKEILDMPENRSFDQPAGGVGGSSTGTMGSPSTGSTGSPSTIGATGNPAGGAGTGAATALSQTAQEYGKKVSEVASQAKDFVSDKVSIVGDKIKDLQNADLGKLANNAKDYTRKNPGQALLISAGVGLLLGLIVRGRR